MAGDRESSEVALAVMGDMVNSRMHMRSGYEKRIRGILNALDEKNKDLKSKDALFTDYVVSGGDSIQTNFRAKEMSKLEKLEELFPEFSDGGNDHEMNYGLGLGRAYYLNRGNSNLCMGEHYINALMALEAAKSYRKAFGLAVKRYDVGLGTLNAALDFTEAFVSSIESSSLSETSRENYQALCNAQCGFLGYVLKWLKRQYRATNIDSKADYNPYEHVNLNEYDNPDIYSALARSKKFKCLKSALKDTVHSLDTCDKEVDASKEDGKVALAYMSTISYFRSYQ